jgi:predicted RND superfamily exporter protein
MTTRYKKERSLGNDKKASVITALSTSIPSVLVSALGLFAATFGVSVYSDVDMIASLCLLMARGAIISMLCVILILPAMFMLFDKIIAKTTIGFLPKKTGGN